MSYEHCDPQFQADLQLAPVASDIQPKAGRGWLNQILMQCMQPMRHEKPDWVHLPDRVWQRQSALLVSMREQKRS